MAGRFNLSRRPFVDTRPANLTAGVLAVVVVALSFVAARTIVRYFTDSSRTRASIASLRTGIEKLEDERRQAEASLQRIDVAALSTDVEDANEIALRRAFSWTRFLSRLETTLPADIRVASIALQKLQANNAAGRPARGGSLESVLVTMTLIARDPNGLPKTIRAFDASPWFDKPTPGSEERGEKGVPEGRRLILSVSYHDAAKEAARDTAKNARKETRP